jgi:hypothetical protein
MVTPAHRQNGPSAFRSFDATAAACNAMNDVPDAIRTAQSTYLDLPAIRAGPKALPCRDLRTRRGGQLIRCCHCCWPVATAGRACSAAKQLYTEQIVGHTLYSYLICADCIAPRKCLDFGTKWKHKLQTRSCRAQMQHGSKGDCLTLAGPSCCRKFETFTRF